MNKWEQVTLDNFNGPLDLLLHLIKEKEVDIMDVNLVEISNQYIEYIKMFEELDIEIASEYLEIAAYLIELKSKLLIPKTEVEVDSNYEENERNELLRRLVEYHKIKELTQYFKDKQVDYLQTFSKPKSVIKVTKIDDEKLPLAENNISMDKFANVFLKILEKNQINKTEVQTINYTEISPEEIANDIREILLNSKKDVWTLEELLMEKTFTIQMLVAIFLAILDLAKNQIIKIEQTDDIIYVYTQRGQ